MKLTTLRLTDFLNHRQTEIEFGPITVIAGPNNSGKSAVKDAIEMVLTGTARTTDKAGREAQSLVRAGTAKFHVGAEVSTGNGNLTLTRSKGLTGGHSFDVVPDTGEPWQGSIGDKQQAVSAKLGVGPGVLRACLHAGRLPEMKPEEQETLFFDLLGLEFDELRLRELATAAGAEGDDFELFCDGPGATFLLAPQRDAYGPWVFDEAYKFAYERRRQTKRDLKDAQETYEVARRAVAEAIAVTPKLETADTKTIEAMKAKMAELETERDRLHELKGQAEVLPGQLQAMAGDLERLESDLQRRLEWEAKRDELAGPDVDLEELVRNGRDELSELKDCRLKLHLEVTELEGAVKAFSEDKPTCPISKTACPLSATTKKKVLATLKAKRAKATKALEELPDLEENRQMVGALAELQAERPTTVPAGDLEKAVTGKKAKLRELQKQQADAAPSEDLEVLKERIANGHAKVRRVENHLARVKQVEDAQQKVADRKLTVDAWERLVTAFGSGGAKLKAVEGPLAELQERINRRLGEFAPGYELAIRTDDGFHLEVKTPDAEEAWLPIRGLSTSERLRIGIALQDALCHLSGLGFLLVDNYDMLDATNRSALGNALRKWSDEYDTIVILATQDGKPAAKPSRTTYWIEHGNAELVQ